MNMGNSSTKGQQSYRQYYDTMMQNPGSQMDLSNVAIDPYEVLGVRKDYTWDELKDSYKRLAKLVHPDKGGNEQLFNTVTTCFKKLAQELKAREADKPHHVLKADAHQYYGATTMEPSHPAASSGQARNFLAPPLMTSKAGDESGDFHSKFNRFFDENKIEDEDLGKHGYGHLMAPSSKKREDIKIDRTLKRFTNESFNKTFEKVAPLAKDVVVYKEPEPMVLAKNIQFTEIGVDKIDDFTGSASGETRNGVGSSGLQYTDYMRAYTNTRLVDPRTVEKRREFRNVEDFEAARAARTQETMTPEEKAMQAQQEAAKEKEEEERLYRIRERDEVAARRADEISRKRLQYF